MMRIVDILISVSQLINLNRSLYKESLSLHIIVISSDLHSLQAHPSYSNKKEEFEHFLPFIIYILLK